jgi:RNA polymerase sigma-70 factor (ECF subfamily)
MAATLSRAREEELVAAARSDDAHARNLACRALHDELQRPLYKVCFQLTGRDEDARDALQDAMFTLFQALPRFRGEARLSTFAYRIATCVALRVRARRRDDLPLEDGAARGRNAGATTNAEARRALETMQALPSEQRLVLALFAIEGLTHPEIADILGVPIGTVWSRLHAARKQMAAGLGPRGARGADATPAAAAG